jgi:hypothetical protein
VCSSRAPHFVDDQYCVQLPLARHTTHAGWDVGGDDGGGKGRVDGGLGSAPGGGDERGHIGFGLGHGGIEGRGIGLSLNSGTRAAHDPLSAQARRADQPPHPPGGVSGAKRHNIRRDFEERREALYYRDTRLPVRTGIAHPERPAPPGDRQDEFTQLGTAYAFSSDAHDAYRDLDGGPRRRRDDRIGGDEDLSDLLAGINLADLRERVRELLHRRGPEHMRTPIPTTGDAPGARLGFGTLNGTPLQPDPGESMMKHQQDISGADDSIPFVRRNPQPPNRDLAKNIAAQSNAARNEGFIRFGVKTKQVSEYRRTVK